MVDIGGIVLGLDPVPAVVAAAAAGEGGGGAAGR